MCVYVCSSKGLLFYPLSVWVALMLIVYLCMFAIHNNVLFVPLKCMSLCVGSWLNKCWCLPDDGGFTILRASHYDNCKTQQNVGQLRNQDYIISEYVKTKLDFWILMLHFVMVPSSLCFLCFLGVCGVFGLFPVFGFPPVLLHTCTASPLFAHPCSQCSSQPVSSLFEWFKLHFFTSYNLLL